MLVLLSGIVSVTTYLVKILTWYELFYLWSQEFRKISHISLLIIWFLIQTGLKQMKTPNLMGVLSKCHILIYYLLLFLSSSVVLVQFLCTDSSVNKVSNVSQIVIIFFCTRLEDFLERLIQVWWDTWLIYQFMLITSLMIISRCVSQELHQNKEQGIAQHTWSVISTRLPIVSEGHSGLISVILSYPVL